MSIRKLVAEDITLHGERFVLIEFGLGTPAMILFALWLMLSRFFFALGLYVFLVGINYLVLLLYVIVIVRKGSNQTEVSDELAHSKEYLRQLGLQQFFILIPLAILILAIFQEAKK
jgi:Ca2+/Na+ antiporter